MMEQTIKTNKSWKISKWLTILNIPLVIIAIHFNFYFSIKSLVNANKSVNPKATEYFVQANTISTVWINAIHNYLFVDYDSPIMKPLIGITNYYFNKGEKLVSENNAEDAVWWFLTYAYIYSINTSDRDDDSMDIYLLPKDEEIKLRYKLADYVIKLGDYGVKGIEFDKYESSAMHAMFAVSFSGINIDKHYTGTTEQDRINHYWKDKKLYDYRVKTYKAYMKFLKNDPYKEGWELYSLNSLSGRLWIFVAKDIRNAEVMTNCKNQYIEKYLNNLNNLVRLINIGDNSIPSKKVKEKSSRLFETNMAVLDILQTSCPKFRTKVKQLKKQLNQIKGE